MILLNKLIIVNYIKKLTREDIINYSKRYNIPLTDDEVNVIYYYIKNRYNVFFDGDELELLEEIKYKVKSATYNKILELYNRYKNKL